MPKGVYKHKPQQGFQKGHKKLYTIHPFKGKTFSLEHRKNLRKANLGKKLSEEHKKKIGEAQEMSKSKDWKGESAGYSSKHKWVVKYYGRASSCEQCSTKDSKKYEWANLDHKYIRDIKYWKQLCTKCHRNYDRSAFNNGAYKKYQ